MKHLRKETEAGKEAPKLAVSPGSAHRCSLFRLIAQDFALLLDKLDSDADEDADEDAVSHLPGCPITAALPSSPSSPSNELRISRSVIYAMYSPTSPRSQQSRTGFIKTL